MATCNYIKAKKQNQSAMRAVIRYVSQDAKTLDEDGHRYLSGINCIGAAAYDEFILPPTTTWYKPVKILR